MNIFVWEGNYKDWQSGVFFFNRISKTVKYKGNRMDIGGHRFFSKNQDVIKFWNEKN